MKTFKEWFNDEDYNLAYGEKGEFSLGAKEAWDYQQAKIDEIEMIISDSEYGAQTMIDRIKDVLNDPTTN